MSTKFCEVDFAKSRTKIKVDFKKSTHIDSPCVFAVFEYNHFIAKHRDLTARVLYFGLRDSINKVS